MRLIRFPILWLSLTLLFASQAAAGSFTFFHGTQYPLTVHYLKGKAPGPTVMIQGGIQGDETAGFVSAQLLAKSEVLTGNLVVVPRANVPSVNARRRQVNVDLNRRFDRDYNQFYEDRLARAIRFLLASSDAFVHLHEGSGFYDPQYIDSLRNPNRYGQSIIIDADRYETIDLKATVREVLEELNPQVQPTKWRFKLFNTKTFEKGTPYAEMRKSLTCYALTAHNIPALAVEVSKDIKDLGWKVRQQVRATVTLLDKLGVDISAPDISDEEVADYARRGVRVAINGRPAKNEVALPPGSVIAVSGEGGAPSFSPSLSVFASDRPGVNLLAAPRMALKPFKDLEVRSDGNRIGTMNVDWRGSWPDAPGDGTPVLVCWLNNQPRFVRPGEVLRAVQGDQILFEGIWGGRPDEIINLKGYVSDPADNNGQDGGREIVLEPDSYIARYLEEPGPGARWRLRITRETKGVEGAEFFIDVTPRKVWALRLKDRHGQQLMIPWTPGGEYHLPPGRYALMDAWSNGPADKLLPLTGSTPLAWGEEIEVSLSEPARLTLIHATTFVPMGGMDFSHGSFAQGAPPFLN